MAEIQWIETGSKVDGHHGHVGELRLFAVFFDATRPTGENVKRYRVECCLPHATIRKSKRYHATKQEAFSFCGAILDRWLVMLSA